MNPQKTTFLYIEILLNIHDLYEMHVPISQMKQADIDCKTIPQNGTGSLGEQRYAIYNKIKLKRYKNFPQTGT